MQGILVMDDDDNGMNGTHGRAEQSRAYWSRTPVNDSGHMLVSRSIDRSSFEVPLKGGTK